MLEGLDEIDWGALEDAYGTAESVPDYLRALTSERSQDRLDALEHLWCTIWHQGTIYSATPHAVPFLLEFASMPDHPNRYEILLLLAHIIDGSGYGLDREYRVGVKQRLSADFQSRMEAERRYVPATREAAWRGLDLFLMVLRDEGPHLCIAAAEALANLARAADENMPNDLRAPDPFPRMARALRERYRMEPDLRVRKALVKHIHALASKVEENAVLVHELATAETDLPVRLEAIFCLTEEPETLLPESAIQLLADLWHDPAAGLSYVRVNLPESDDEGEEDDEDDIASPWEIREICEKVFDALHCCRQQCPDLFGQILAGALEQQVCNQLKIIPPRPLRPDDWAQVRSIDVMSSGQELDLNCDELVPLLRSCVNLERLSLRSDRITDTGIQALPILPLLYDLNLSGTRVTDVGMECLRRFPMLAEVLLSHTVVSDGAMRYVAELTRLKRLWAIRSNIGDAGAAQLATLVHLEELNLGETPIADPGAAALAQLPRLRKLDLLSTAVKGACLGALAHAPSLEELNLGNTLIDDADLAYLRPFRVLQDLSLHMNHITDDALPYLARLRGLKRLSLSHTEVTKAGIEGLRRELPGCAIDARHLESR